MNPSPSTPAATASPVATPTAPTWNDAAVQALADSLGTSARHDAYGPFLDLGSTGWDIRLGGVAVLPEFGLITVSGEAGAQFLHGQLTQDIEHLQAGQARWAGYCSPKGRLMASFRAWRGEDGVVRLALSRPLTASIARRLSMFVLRAKAKVTDTSDASVVFGLIGEAAARAAVQGTTVCVPMADAASVAAGIELIGLPPLPQDAGPELPRWLLVVPAAEAASTWSRLCAAVPALHANGWRRSEVLAGVARIVPATSEHFVPQMVNFESVDGVSFTKGCYPGQEVVARSQYLGKLKRRMFLASGSAELPLPAQDVHPLAEGSDPCGEVVLAAPDGRGGFDVLFESQLDAVEQAGVRIGSNALTLRPLPYPLRPAG